ncbi:hypothetical protein ACWGLF_41055 [Streptomyces puniciscabiei]
MPTMPKADRSEYEVGEQHDGANNQQMEQATRGEPDDAQDEGCEDQEQETESSTLPVASVVQRRAKRRSPPAPGA